MGVLIRLVRCLNQIRAEIKGIGAIVFLNLGAAKCLTRESTLNNRLIIITERTIFPGKCKYSKPFFKGLRGTEGANKQLKY
ncbi:hypothetical protein JCM39068_38030 [Desulfocastanea catecholica]